MAQVEQIELPKWTPAREFVNQLQGLAALEILLKIKPESVT